MTLHITLKPGESIIVGGARIGNTGTKRADLTLCGDAAVLHSRSVMPSDLANTPARRIYFMAQLIYVDPDRFDLYAETFLSLVRDISSVISTAEGMEIIAELAEAAAQKCWWRALRTAAKLVDYEAIRLGPVTGAAVKAA